VSISARRCTHVLYGEMLLASLIVGHLSARSGEMLSKTAAVDRLSSLENASILTRLGLNTGRTGLAGPTGVLIDGDVQCLLDVEHTSNGHVGAAKTSVVLVVLMHLLFRLAIKLQHRESACRTSVSPRNAGLLKCIPSPQGFF
jgi:hypothetical protein